MQRVLGGDGLGEEAVAVLLLKPLQHLGEEERGALAAAVWARVHRVARRVLVELRIVEPIAPSDMTRPTQFFIRRWGAAWRAYDVRYGPWTAE